MGPRASIVLWCRVGMPPLQYLTQWRILMETRALSFEGYADCLTEGRVPAGCCSTSYGD
jgi:hypothetical protein